MTDKPGIASYISSGAIAGAGAWTVNEWLMVGGFLLGLATFAVNWYFKLRRDQREQAEADMRREQFRRA